MSLIAQRPLLIGHRGAPVHAPEHTASGYRLAVAQGADAVEPDLVPTRDGVLLVRHEPLLDETTDIGRHPALAARRTTFEHDGTAVEGACSTSFDWDELRVLRAVEPLPELRATSAALDGLEGLLRLRDLVALLDDEDALGRPCRLVIELKHPAAFAAAGLDLVDLVQRELEGEWDRPALQGLVWESFERDALHRVRAAGLPGALVVLMDGAGGPADRPGTSYADELTPEGLAALAVWVDGISVHVSQLGVETREDAADPAVGRALVEAAHRHGLGVFAYTLRPEDRFLPSAFAGDPAAYWAGLLATGLDGVFADDPAAVRRVIDRMPPRDARRSRPAPAAPSLEPPVW